MSNYLIKIEDTILKYILSGGYQIQEKTTGEKKFYRFKKIKK